jgi:dihydrofolate reductase
MGKLVVTEFVTVDGVFEDPGGSEGTKHGGWSFTVDGGQEFFEFKGAELEAADAQLLGRVTYEGFAQAWPERKGDPFSDKFNSMPKYVVSQTLSDPSWENSTVIDLAEVPRLTQRYAGDVLVNGSGRLVRSLLAAGLVDELRLMIFPLILGSGQRLLAADPPSAAAGGGATKLTLTESRPIGGDGIFLHIYRPRA